MVPYRFLTLTFRECKKVQSQYHSVILDLLKYLNKVGTYRLVPELTEKGVLHFHIMVKVKDMVKFKVLNNYWQKTHGFVDIKPVNKEFGCFIYIRKDTLEMVQLLWDEIDPLLAIITNISFPYVCSKLIERNNKATKVRKLNKIQGALDKFYKL